MQQDAMDALFSDIKAHVGINSRLPVSFKAVSKEAI
jgi:hypothetical protein